MQGWEFAHLISERIASFLSKMRESLMVAHFWWAKWEIHLHRSFDLSEMSDSLTSLAKKEEMNENERFAHFFKKDFVKNRKT